MLSKYSVLAILAIAFIESATAVTEDEFKAVLDRLTAVEDKLATSSSNGKAMTTVFASVVYFLMITIFVYYHPYE